MKRLLIASLLVVCVLMPVFATGSGERDWPIRNITTVVSSGAGGGTDLGNRAMGAAMEGFLGTRISVVNNPAGGGGAAADQVFSAPHDGYMWLGFFEGIFSNAVIGSHHGTSNDWDYFILGGTPGLMSVAADSPYQSAADVINAMKANPGNIRLACSSVGTIWDIKSSLLAEAADVEYRYMPYQGSNPSILALIAGEVDVIITGLGEQVEFLQANRLRPLAMIELYGMRVPGYNHEVPPITNTVPGMARFLPVDQTIGFAIPANTPDNVKARITDAFVRALETPSLRQYTENYYVTISGAHGAASKEIARKMESTLGWVLYEKGVAQNSPASLGIPRP